MSRFSRKYVNLNISQPYGPPQPVTLLTCLISDRTSAHPASYSKGARGSSLGNKASGTWNWLLISIHYRVQEGRSYTLILPYIFMTWLLDCIIMYKDNFAFTINIWQGLQILVRTSISWIELTLHRTVATWVDQNNCLITRYFVHSIHQGYSESKLWWAVNTTINENKILHTKNTYIL
jgi:hypothetical protein